MVLVRRVEERVAVALEQRLVRVHPAAVHAGDRLRHERGVDAELVGDLLHGEAIGHHLVGHRERVGVAEVDLVLGRRDLVVDVLDGDPHRLEVLHGALAVVGGDVERRLVEVAALVEEGRVVDRPEVEVLELRTDVEREPLVRGPGELTLEDPARVAVERRAVRLEDVAEHPRHRLLGLPRDHLEGGGVGERHHVGFLDAGEPVDRGAVEAHPSGEGALELLRGDRERLQEPEDVGEPEANEADPSLLDRAQDVLGFGGESHVTEGRGCPSASCYAGVNLHLTERRRSS